MIDSTGVEWPDEIWVHRRGETAKYFYSTTSIPPGAFYKNEFEYAYDMPMQVYFSFPSQIECLTESDAENECIKWLTDKLTRRGFSVGSVQPTPTSSKLKMIQAMGRISRASLEERTQRVLITHQDVKIPDGPIVIDKDLLLDIRDAIDAEASDGNEYCAQLRDKLDKIYPFLC
mgnify:CR=1 FL=1